MKRIISCLLILVLMAAAIPASAAAKPARLVLDAPFGVYGEELIDNVVGIDNAHRSLLEYDGAINLMKGGIECANAVSTVSPSYAREILDPWYSHGLDTILRERQWKLQGILNGIDVINYDPETDKAIAKNYTVKDVKEAKAICKADLQKELGRGEGLNQIIVTAGGVGAPFVFVQGFCCQKQNGD